MRYIFFANVSYNSFFLSEYYCIVNFKIISYINFIFSTFFFLLVCRLLWNSEAKHSLRLAICYLNFAQNLMNQINEQMNLIKIVFGQKQTAIYRTVDYITFVGKMKRLELNYSFYKSVERKQESERRKMYGGLIAQSNKL